MASREFREDMLHHVTAYAQLAAVETTLLVRDAKQRLIWSFAAVLLAVLALTLLGVAAMLLSTVSAMGDGGLGERLAAHPALWIVPTIAAAAAVFAALRSQLGGPRAAFPALRSQLAADMGRARAEGAGPPSAQESS